MKYKKIILFFCIALPLSVIMRMMQLIYTIDTATGFFKQEFQTVGVYLLIIIAAFSAVTAILSLTSHRNPEKPPKPNILLSLSAVACSVSLFYEIFTEKFAAPVRQWQATLLMLFGLLAGIYLIIYAIKPFFDVPIPKISAITLSLYIIMRIICTFTSISSLALISDNLILIAAYCACLIFAVSFAKLYNKIDTERNFRKLLASGLTSIILCFTESVPNIIFNFYTDNSYLHTSQITNVSTFFMGVFITVFTFTYFRAKKKKTLAIKY